MSTITKKSNILFVDDEVNILEGIHRTLRHKRSVWEMNYARSVNEALHLLNNKNIDAVVSDVSMPGKDGFALLSAVRSTEHIRDIPVTILTGLSDRGIKRRALDMGATDLLSKPVDPDEFVARINNMLRLKSYQDEIKAHQALLEQKVRVRTAELEAAHIELIWQLGKAAEYRDTDTGNHVVRVGYYSHVLAETLGMAERFSEMVFLTAPLHDVGKIGIPDHILLKQGKLDADEWRIMRDHCEIGVKILRQEMYTIKDFKLLLGLKSLMNSVKRDNPFLRMASSIALNHHERWDGTGYPRGLKGEDIPLEARITAISDVYDALFSKRPYKPIFSEEKAFSEIRSGIGAHFDPEIFNAFEKATDIFRDIRRQFADDDTAAQGKDKPYHIVPLRG